MAMITILATYALVLNYGLAHKVVIIGGGASGMAAASKLCEGGIHDLLVVEAQDRLGGRIHSVTVGDAKVDLGAEFVYGEKNNVVYETFKDEIHHTSQKMQQLPFVYSSGESIDVELNEDLVRMLNSTWGFSNLDDEELTLGGYFTDQYNKTILEKYKNNSKVWRQAVDALKSCEKAIMDSSFSWFDVAASWPYEENEGDKFMNWNGKGYVTVINYFKKHLMHPDKQISLNKQIIKIKWDDPQGVKLEAMDGTTFAADHVIFTPSLGFLKANYENLFDPALPKAKIDAIKALGYGAVMKVILQFSTRWWKEEDAAPTFVWTEADLKNINTLYPRGVLKNGESWLPYFVGWAEAPANPNVLIGWFSGKLIPEIEKLSEAELQNGIMFVAKHFFRNKYKNIPDPIKSLHSTWFNNPLFRGTYSYDTLESNKIKGHEILGEPLMNSTGSPVVLFAGEATSHKHYSTVHGAVDAGYKEARRLLKQ